MNHIDEGKRIPEVTFRVRARTQSYGREACLSFRAKRSSLPAKRARSRTVRAPRP